MLTTLAGWALTQGASALFGVLAKLALDAWTEYQNSQNQIERGRLESELTQSREAERVQAELAEQAARRVPEDEALRRLEEGSA